MSWYARSWQYMESVRRANLDMEPAEIAKEIDSHYPYCERSGWAYKAWLAARRDFFRKHQIPLRRARRPKDDLLSTCEGGLL